MKLVISFDELYTQPLNRELIDVSDYRALTKAYLTNTFQNWDYEIAFNDKTWQIDTDNKEVSIQLREID